MVPLGHSSITKSGKSRRIEGIITMGNGSTYDDNDEDTHIMDIPRRPIKFHDIWVIVAQSVEFNFLLEFSTDYNDVD